MWRPDKPVPPPLGQLGSPEAREATVAPVPGAPVCHPYPFGPCGPCGPFGLPVIAVLAAGPLVPIASGTHETLGHAGLSALRMREVREPAAYAPAMGLFRSAMGLFRGRAGKDREQAAAELPNEQARTVKAQPVVAREVKREARPDPDKPGWGRAIG